MIRWLTIAAVTLLLLLVSLAAGTSDAAFTSANTSAVSAAVAGAPTLLSLHSQASDPNGQSGYYTIPGTTTPAATGTDATLTVDLGKQNNVNTTCNRVFCIKAPPSLPSGLTSITVTASLVSDPATGVQPIKSIGFTTWGGTSRTNPITLSASAKRQCNLVVNALGPSGTVYRPTVLITIRYSAFSGTFFRYSVPFTITAS